MNDATTREYEIANAEALRAAHPDTFDLPPLVDRCGIGPGEWAKLYFVPRVRPTSGPNYERMWVRVTGCRGAWYVGRLDNDPEVVAGIACGDVIEFGPEHVIDIARSASEWPVRRLSKQYALVSRRVVAGEAPPRALRRDAPVDEDDSGWQVLAGDESRAYLDDDANLGFVHVSGLLERHPELVPLISAPIGTIWEWDVATAQFERTSSPRPTQPRAKTPRRGGRRVRRRR